MGSESLQITRARIDHTDEDVCFNMNESTMVVALVPARGGSKGIPGKNLRTAGGHPLVAWAVAAGKQAERVERVILSTDDPDIAEVGRAYGAEVPFMRPGRLAEDDVRDLPVFRHALEWLEEADGTTPSVFVHLRPTAPARPPDCVDRAVHMLEKDQSADSVRSVIEPRESPFKMWRPVNGGLRPLLEPSDGEEGYDSPRQELPAVYWHSGHVDAFRTRTIREKNSLAGDRVLPLEISRRYALDVDEPPDLEVAKWLLARRDLNLVRPTRFPALRSLELVAFDFDGVFTDDRVLVLEDGTEGVLCNRGDGFGLERIAQVGIEAVVITREANPVVEQRCQKLSLPCYSNVKDKAALFQTIIAEAEVDRSKAAFVGNDVSDLEAMELSGVSFAPADARATVREEADIVTRKKGGSGAVREICELILDAKNGLEARDGVI